MEASLGDEGQQNTQDEAQGGTWKKKGWGLPEYHQEAGEHFLHLLINDPERFRRLVPGENKMRKKTTGSRMPKNLSRYLFERHEARVVGMNTQFGVEGVAALVEMALFAMIAQLAGKKGEGEDDRGAAATGRGDRSKNREGPQPQVSGHPEPGQGRTWPPPSPPKKRPGLGVQKEVASSDWGTSVNMERGWGRRRVYPGLWRGKRSIIKGFFRRSCFPQKVRTREGK